MLADSGRCVRHGFADVPIFDLPPSKYRSPILEGPYNGKAERARWDRAEARRVARTLKKAQNVHKAKARPLISNQNHARHHSRIR